MRTIETTVYFYSELSDEAKEKARAWYLEGAYDYDWHDFIYDEAKNLGFTIENFDLYKRTCSIALHDTAEAIAKKIVAEHGEDCATFKTASQFLADFPEVCKTQDESKKDARLEEFEHALAEDYREMLQAEYNHIGSEENIADAMIANEYEFTGEGKRI